MRTVGMKQDLRCRVVTWSKPGKGKAKQDASVGEFPWQESRLRVHEEQSDGQEAEDGRLYGEHGQAEPNVTGGEKNGDQQLDCGIAQRNPRTACATPAAEKQPAQNRDVVAPTNRRLAGGTVRPWRDDGLIAWNAADANIQETA
jgi:hypothetical protein